MALWAAATLPWGRRRRVAAKFGLAHLAEALVSEGEQLATSVVDRCAIRPEAVNELTAVGPQGRPRSRPAASPFRLTETNGVPFPVRPKWTPRPRAERAPWAAR